MNNKFPSKNDFGVEQSISVLEDGETFSSAEGSFWALMPTHFNTDDIEEQLEENDVFKLHTDAMPYLVRAGFLSLGIDPDRMTCKELLSEIDGCTANNEAEMETIQALRLALKW